jgi:isopentenyl-diphosphate delta-isomerase
MNKVILVDLNNNKIGTEDKIEAHKKSLLHRAFSIFIFNHNKEILLQKRAENKYHSGSLWTNTCCSHPYIGLSTVKCAQIRLNEEMGIKAELHEVFSFIYKEPFANGLTEYEYDHVFFGKHSIDPILNPDEASDFKWMKIFDLKLDIDNNPSSYTAWLKIIFNKHFKYFESYENNNLQKKSL